jgi:hypothetical protein
VGGHNVIPLDGQRCRQVLASTAGICAAVFIDQSAPGNRNQPSERSIRQATRPLLGREDESLLHRVLGVREFTVAAGQRTERLRGEFAQQALDVGPGHISGSGAPSTWRTSICCWIATPPGPGAADERAAISSARSRLATSIRRYPASNSFDSG